MERLTVAQPNVALLITFKSIAQDVKPSALHAAHVMEFFRVKSSLSESEVPFWGDVVEAVWRRGFIKLPFIF